MQERKFANIQVLFTPETVVPFLISSISLSVLGSAVYGILTNVFGADTNTLAGIIIGAVIIGVVTARLFVRIVDDKLRPSVVQQPPAKHKVLILLVGREEPCRIAIEWHSANLRYCYFLYTMQSQEAAERLAVDITLARKSAELILLLNALNVKEVYDEIEKIYTNPPRGIVESDIILDCTGLTSAATIASVANSLNHKRHIQYVPSIYDDVTHSISSLDPISLDFLDSH